MHIITGCPVLTSLTFFSIYENGYDNLHDVSEPSEHKLALYCVINIFHLVNIDSLGMYALTAVTIYQSYVFCLCRFLAAARPNIECHRVSRPYRYPERVQYDYVHLNALVRAYSINPRSCGCVLPLGERI